MRKTCIALLLGWALSVGSVETAVAQADTDAAEQAVLETEAAADQAEAAAEAVVNAANDGQAAPAAQTNVALGNEDILENSLSALTMLFVLAVLLENAFALIFNWRVFQAFFSDRGMRTLVMAGVSILLVYQLDIDIVAALIAAYTRDAAPNGHVTRIVTALILAGGSGGVHNLMYALGYRSKRAEIEELRPTKNQAWLAVRVTRQRAEGEIFISIRKLGSIDSLPADAVTPVPDPIAGTVGSGGPTLRGLLLRDRSRFPQNGGYLLEPNTLYTITVAGRDANGNPIEAIPPLTAKRLVLAPGAIVDLETTV